MAKLDIDNAIVAPYKSVDVDGQLFGPGDKVTLPKAEIASLRAKGFLVDPAGAATDAANEQPNVTVTTDTSKSSKPTPAKAAKTPVKVATTEDGNDGSDPDGGKPGGGEPSGGAPGGDDPNPDAE